MVGRWCELMFPMPCILQQCVFNMDVLCVYLWHYFIPSLLYRNWLSCFAQWHYNVIINIKKKHRVFVIPLGVVQSVIIPQWLKHPLNLLHYLPTNGLILWLCPASPSGCAACLGQQRSPQLSSCCPKKRRLRMDRGGEEGSSEWKENGSKGSNYWAEYSARTPACSPTLLLITVN